MVRKMSKGNADRRYEAVALAIRGHTVDEIAKKMRVSPMRVQGMITQQAGKDFYPQLVLERKKRKAKYLGFGRIEEIRTPRKEVMPE